MSENRLESFRKWMTLSVSTLALLFSAVLGPIVLSLKATIRDQLRQDFINYETISAADVRWKAHQQYENEVFKRLEQELSAVRAKAAIAEANYKVLMEVEKRLSSIETKIELLMKEYERDKKLKGGNDPP